MASLISRVGSYVTGNARLFIEYILILVIIVLGVYGTVAYFRTKALTDTTMNLSEKLGRVSGTLDQQVTANADQDKAIDELKHLREIDSKALGDLHNELDKADNKGQALRDKVRQLEKTNADAKALLDTTVPAALGCVLDGRPCAGPSGNDPNGGAAGKAR
jgi:hypothetical protein